MFEFSTELFWWFTQITKLFIRI